MNLRKLVAIQLMRGKRNAILSALGVSLGIASLLFFVAAGVGVSEWVRGKIVPVDLRQIEVVPPKVALGFLQGGRLDDAAVERLSELSGVQAVHRKMEVRIPAVSRYDGAFFGKRLRMGLEIVAEGVDGSLLGVDEEAWRAPKDGEALPVALSERLVEIYNRSFARARGLPHLGPQLLLGFEFPVDFGSSFVSEREERTVRRSARVVAFSERAMLQGITVPLEAAREINRRFGREAETYSSVVLEAERPDAVPALVEEVRRLGFEVDESERRLAERLGAGVAVVSGTLALLGLIILGLAAVNIALSLGAQVRSRSREIGVMRALGATPRAIAGLVLGEALVIGVVGTLTGIALALGAAHGVDAWLVAQLSELPFRPDSFFRFSPTLLLVAAGVGVGAAMLGALPPARRASRLDPSRVMME